MNRTLHLALANLFIAFFLLYAQGAIASQGVQVLRGPTPIPNGDAQSAQDITLTNEKLAVAFAVETGAPWGVARGGILDGAVVEDEEIKLDHVTLIDFIPNNWSSWPTTYQRVTVLKDTPEEAIIQTERDWGQCDLVTTYTLGQGSDRMHMKTVMTNTGDTAKEDILSGYVLWCTGGSHFGPAGLSGREEGSRQGTMSDWSVTYDQDWAITIHGPYFDHFDYDGRDLYLKHTLQPGQSRTFEGWLQITPSGDLAPVLQAEIERKESAHGSVQGTVSTPDGDPVNVPYIVARKKGETYTWARGDQGAFDMTLPAGEYELYATAKGHAPSTVHKVSVQNGQSTELTFADLQSPGRVSFTITESTTEVPLDARISIQEGVQPVIGFLGQNIFFTELENQGMCQAALAPGEYTFQIQAGSPFFSLAQDVQLTVPSKDTVQAQVNVPSLARPQGRNWYGVDLHHHSDQLDGKTPPELLVRSQLAAGLDFLFLSDHDTTVNHVQVWKLAQKRGVPFVPAIEISPSWGHFNAYPLQLGLPWTVDTSQADVQTLFAAARDMGAEVIGVNHPFIKYGYFTNLANNSTQGGFEPGFDLIELNGAVDYEKALHKAWSLWDKGWETYLQGGTDAHDVMLEKEISGSMRTMAYIPGAVTVDNLIRAVQAGHSYATTGPLVYPNGLLFGDTLTVQPGEKVHLAFEAVAAQGLSQVDLVRNGEVTDTMSWENTPLRSDFVFDLQVSEDGWASLVVTDQNGNAAYTNPIWLKVREYTADAE